MIGLGLGLSARSAPAPLDLDLRILAIGDSLQERKFSQASGQADTAFETEALTFFDTASHESASQGGTYLMQATAEGASPGSVLYWWDEATPGKGARYTALIDPVSDKDTVDAVIVALGTNDAVRIDAGDATASEWKTAFQEFLTQIIADFPNLKHILINPMARHTAGGYSAEYQDLRQAQLETIAEMNGAFHGVEIYDLDNTDNVHLTQSGLDEMAEREARRMAGLMGTGPLSGTTGPVVASASLVIDTITATVSHNGGSDLTIPSDAENMFGIEDDGSVFEPASVTKNSGSELSFSIPEGTGPVQGSVMKLLTCNGSMGDLSDTSPEAVMDNTSNIMPLRSSIITVTEANPVYNLPALQAYMNARACTKTYASATLIQSISGLVGSGFQRLSAGREPDFDSTAFGGHGGIRASDGSRDLVSTDQFTQQENRFLFFTLDVDASITANRFALLFGWGAFGESRAGFLITSGNALQYARDSGDGFPNLASGINDSKLLVMADYVDADTLNIYVNGYATPTATINPHDNYNDQNPNAGHIWLCGRSQTDGCSEVAIADVGYALAGPSAAQRQALYDLFNDRYTLG